MRFEWDPEKARTNRIKHGVSFETAMQVWRDPHAIFFVDDHVDGEERWHAIGVVGSATMLLVVYVERGEDVVRLISARKAVPWERRTYEQ